MILIFETICIVLDFLLFYFCLGKSTIKNVSILGDMFDKILGSKVDEFYTKNSQVFQRIKNPPTLSRETKRAHDLSVTRHESLFPRARSVFSKKIFTRHFDEDSRSRSHGPLMRTHRRDRRTV